MTQIYVQRKRMKATTWAWWKQIKLHYFLFILPRASKFEKINRSISPSSSRIVTSYLQTFSKLFMPIFRRTAMNDIGNDLSFLPYLRDLIISFQTRLIRILRSREKHLQYYSLLQIRESVAMVMIKELSGIFIFKYFKYTEWKVCVGYWKAISKRFQVLIEKHYKAIQELN